MSDPTTPREIIASLRQQITAMKKEWEEERREIAELRAHAERVGQANDRLVLENDALRKDKARLDWLTDIGCWLTFPSLSKRPNWDHGTARDVIDAARKEAQQ